MSASFQLLGTDWSAMAERSTQPLGPLAAVSIIVGLPLLWPIGWLFEALHLPIMHRWGLAHGAYVYAWPLASAGFFLVAWALVSLRPGTRPTHREHKSEPSPTNSGDAS